MVLYLLLGQGPAGGKHPAPCGAVGISPKLKVYKRDWQTSKTRIPPVKPVCTHLFGPGRGPKPELGAGPKPKPGDGGAWYGEATSGLP